MTEQQLRVWQNFVVLAETVGREVGRDLWDDAGLTGAEFTVLAELRLRPGGTMRPSQCARSIGWETSRLSHQLRRMEKRGLIVRDKRAASEESDGRAATITLTHQGLSAYRRAIGPHLRSARRWFVDALDGDSLGHLDDALAVLLDHVRRTAESSVPAAGGDAQRKTDDEVPGPPARRSKGAS